MKKLFLYLVFLSVIASPCFAFQFMGGQTVTGGAAEWYDYSDDFDGAASLSYTDVTGATSGNITESGGYAVGVSTTWAQNAGECTTSTGSITHTVQADIVDKYSANDYWSGIFSSNNAGTTATDGYRLFMNETNDRITITSFINGVDNGSNYTGYVITTTDCTAIDTEDNCDAAVDAGDIWTVRLIVKDNEPNKQFYLYTDSDSDGLWCVCANATLGIDSTDDIETTHVGLWIYNGAGGQVADNFYFGDGEHAPTD